MKIDDETVSYARHIGDEDINAEQVASGKKIYET